MNSSQAFKAIIAIVLGTIVLLMGLGAAGADAIVRGLPTLPVSQGVGVCIAALAYAFGQVK